MRRAIVAIATAALIVAPALASAETNNPTGLYRLYSARVGEHFYTTDYNEAFSLDRSGLYRLEGVEGHVYTAPYQYSVPLYRLYSRKQNRHFLTTSETELAIVQRQGFRLEGVIGYMSFTTGGSATGMQEHNLHRLYNPKTKDHFYTANDDEMFAVERAGYTREPDMGYLYR